jgi:hypothetical protein
VDNGIVSQTTVEDFERVGTVRTPLHPFATEESIRLITPTERDNLKDQVDVEARRNNGLSPGDALWRAFSRVYTGSHGIVSLSKVGFDSQHTEAIVETQYDSGGNITSAHLMLLRKDSGVWKIVRPDVAGEQTSATFRGGACVAVEAPGTIPSDNEVERLVGDFDLVQTELPFGDGARRITFRIRLVANDSLGRHYWQPRDRMLVGGYTREYIARGSVLLDGNGSAASTLGVRLETTRDYPILTIADSKRRGFDQTFRIREIRGRTFFGDWIVPSNSSYFPETMGRGTTTGQPRSWREGYFCAAPIP